MNYICYLIRIHILFLYVFAIITFIFYFNDKKIIYTYFFTKKNFPFSENKMILWILFQRYIVFITETRFRILVNHVYNETNNVKHTSKGKKFYLNIYVIFHKFVSSGDCFRPLSPTSFKILLHEES